MHDRLSAPDGTPFGTMLSGLFPLRLSRKWRPAQLFAEGLIVTWVSTLLPTIMGLEEVGMVAMFLVAAALTDRFVYLLEENRWIIFDDRSLSSTGANGLISVSILLLFLGILTGFSTVAVYMGESDVLRAFSFVVRVAHLDGQDVFHRGFGTFGGVLAHNLGVLFVVMLLSFLYRAYGAMLALAWNACVWAIVLTVLVHRAVASNPAEGIEVIARALIGIGPHLICEGTAFVVGSVAAIFLSKAIFLHSPTGPVFWSVVRSVCAMVAVSILLLTTAAYLESVLPVIFL